METHGSPITMWQSSHLQRSTQTVLRRSMRRWARAREKRSHPFEKMTSFWTILFLCTVWLDLNLPFFVFTGPFASLVLLKRGFVREIQESNFCPLGNFDENFCSKNLFCNIYIKKYILLLRSEINRSVHYKIRQNHVNNYDSQWVEICNFEFFLFTSYLGNSFFFWSCIKLIINRIVLFL